MNAPHPTDAVRLRRYWRCSEVAGRIDWARDSVTRVTGQNLGSVLRHRLERFEQGEKSRLGRERLTSPDKSIWMSIPEVVRTAFVGLKILDGAQVVEAGLHRGSEALRGHDVVDVSGRQHLR